MTRQGHEAVPAEPVRPLRRWLLTGVLWLGLLLCTLVLLRHGRDFSGVIARLDGWVVVAGVACMLAALLGGAAAWRQTVQVIAGATLTPAAALRQVGMLLVGKYVPGGVFGFLARVYDGQHAGSRASLVAAGLYEQCLGLFILSVTGALLYAAAFAGWPWLLLSLAVVPVAAVAASRLAFSMLGSVPWTRLRMAIERMPDLRVLRSGLLRSALLAQGSTLAWAAVVVLVAWSGFGTGLLAAIGLAGAFALAVTLGMLAVFAPGGIGIREAAFVLLCGPWLDGTAAVLLAAAMRILAVAFDVFAGAVAAFIGPGPIDAPFPRSRGRM